jgi:hypothetical protein
MDDLEPTEDEILAGTVSDEALEAAAAVELQPRAVAMDGAGGVAAGLLLNTAAQSGASTRCSASRSSAHGAPCSGFPGPPLPGPASPALPRPQPAPQPPPKGVSRLDLGQ